MNEDVQKVDIDYDVGQNRFIVELNDDIFYFSPSQYMEFVNYSIVAINSVIAEKFSSSLKGFLDGKKTDKKRRKKEIAFTEEDSALISNEVEQYFKEHPISG